MKRVGSSMFREERIWLTHKWRMKKKEPPPPNKTERLHVMKMIVFFFFFCSLSYATTSTHAKTRNSTERHDKEKAKSTYLTARLFLCLLFLCVGSIRWPNMIVDSILCGTTSPAHTFFSYYSSIIIYSQKIWEGTQ